MRTFDLRVVQRALRHQLEATEDLFEVIDSLKAVRKGLDPDKQSEIDTIVSRLSTASIRIVDSAGDVSDDLQRFMQ
ncbi:hypothetical protein WCLP8_4000029 [uncultured Gammaproteobacteria bacterium]